MNATRKLGIVLVLIGIGLPITFLPLTKPTGPEPLEKINWRDREVWIISERQQATAGKGLSGWTVFLTKGKYYTDRGSDSEAFNFISAAGSFVHVDRKEGRGVTICDAEPFTLPYSAFLAVGTLVALTGIGLAVLNPDRRS